VSSSCKAQYRLAAEDLTDMNDETPDPVFYEENKDERGTLYDFKKRKAGDFSFYLSSLLSH
jgi:hypothetical protein